MHGVVVIVQLGQLAAARDRPLRQQKDVKLGKSEHRVLQGGGPTYLDPSDLESVEQCFKLFRSNCITADSACSDFPRSMPRHRDLRPKGKITLHGNLTLKE